VAAAQELFLNRQVVSVVHQSPEDAMRLQQGVIGTEAFSGKPLRITRDEQESDPYSGPVVYRVSLNEVSK